MKAIPLLNGYKSKLQELSGSKPIDTSFIDEAIKELEEYESNMDIYFDRTTNSRCSKSFNSDIERVTEVFLKCYESKA